VSSLSPAPNRAEPGSFVFTAWLNKLHAYVTKFQDKAGPPTTDEIAPGEWAMYKDSTGGTLKIYANDGGTIKSVTLT